MINATRSQGIASHESPGSQENALDRSMDLNCFNGVTRARRVVTAPTREHRRNTRLIDAHRNQQRAHDMLTNYSSAHLRLPSSSSVRENRRAAWRLRASRRSKSAPSSSLVAPSAPARPRTTTRAPGSMLLRRALMSARTRRLIRLRRAACETCFFGTTTPTRAGVVSPASPAL